MKLIVMLLVIAFTLIHCNAEPKKTPTMPSVVPTMTSKPLPALQMTNTPSVTPTPSLMPTNEPIWIEAGEMEEADLWWTEYVCPGYADDFEKMILMTISYKDFPVTIYLGFDGEKWVIIEQILG